MLLGLDVGGTKCACLIGDEGGGVLKRVAWPTEAQRGPDAIIHDLLMHARRLLASHAGVTRVGVSIGGPMDAERGIIHNPPNLPGWDGVPLRDLLSEALSLPVRVHHDAAACALAEAAWGAGRDADSVAYLTCGTGFGMGLVVDGRPFYGSHGRGPELGHVRLTDGGPVGFGVAGSAEGWCAGGGLARIATLRYPDRWPANSLSPEDLQQLAEQGDRDAQRVVIEHGEKTGMACAIVADLFHPEVLTLGSMARYLGPTWLDAVRSAYKSHVIPGCAELTRVQPAGLGERIQDASALAAALT